MMESTAAKRELPCWANALSVVSRAPAVASVASFHSEVGMKERMSRIYNSSCRTDQVTDERVPSVPIRSERCGFMLVE